MKINTTLLFVALCSIISVKEAQAEPVLYGSAWSNLLRGLNTVANSSAGPLSNCTSRSQRDRYCDVPNGEIFDSLLEIEHFQSACVNEVTGTVEGQVSSYVYLFPCERAPNWNGPFESTYGQASSTLVVPFVVNQGTWTLQINGSSEFVYSENEGASWCSASIESAGGDLLWHYKRTDIADGIDDIVASVELPVGFYVIRLWSFSESRIEPLGFGAALSRLSISTNIPPTTPPICPGDADGDRVVSFPDIVFVLRNWARVCDLP